MGTSNRVVCTSCKARWCWICKGRPGSTHFAFYSVFGCPGLLHTPNFLPVALLLNLLTSLLFPVSWLFAPMIILLRYYPRQRMIEDQSARFQKQTWNILHPIVTHAIVLIGTAALSLLVGILLSPILSVIGWLYQAVKVTWAALQAMMCCRKEVAMISPRSLPTRLSMSSQDEERLQKELHKRI